MSTKKPRNPDHVRRHNSPQADNEAITQHLQDLLSPAIYRNRIQESGARIQLGILCDWWMNPGV